MDRPHYLQEVPRHAARTGESGAADSNAPDDEGIESRGLGEVQGSGESVSVDGESSLGGLQGHSEGAGIRKETGENGIRRTERKVKLTFGGYRYPDLSKLNPEEAEQFRNNPGKFAQSCLDQARLEDILVNSVFVLAGYPETRLIPGSAGFYAVMALVALQKCQKLEERMLRDAMHYTRPSTLTTKED